MQVFNIFLLPLYLFMNVDLNQKVRISGVIVAGKFVDM